MSIDEKKQHCKNHGICSSMRKSECAADYLSRGNAALVDQMLVYKGATAVVSVTQDVAK